MMIRSATTRRRRLLAVTATLPILLGAVSCAEGSANTATSSADVDAAVSAAPAGSFDGEASSGDPVKVGLINPQGGPAINQPEGLAASQAVVKYANEHLGGLGGRPVELVVCKNKEDAASAAACANQMVEAGVVGVVSTNTSQGDAMAPIITGSGISYTGYNGTSPSELTGSPSYVWTGAFPGTLASMAKYAVSSGYKDLTLYVTDAPQVVGGATAIAQPAFDAAGVALDIVPIPIGAPDVTPQVQAGLAKKPGAVAIVGDATMCSATLKALGTLGATAEKLVIQPCMDPAVVEAAGDVLEGSKLLTTSDGSSDDAEATLFRAVMATYAPDTTLGGASGTAYQSMLGFIRAAAAVQSDDITAASVATAIGDAKDVVLPVGHGATFTCDGSAIPGLSAICSSSQLVATIKDGKPTDFQLLS
jgi:branched-chain amino acid transport system substrate-binding protein